MLIKQASMRPTRKLSASVVTAAGMAAIGLVLRNVAPSWYDPEAMMAFTPIAAFLVGYLVHDEDNTP